MGSKDKHLLAPNRVAMKIKKHTCARCRMEFRSPILLMNHMRSKHCDQCDASCHSVKSVREHKRRTHGPPSVPKESSTTPPSMAGGEPEQLEEGEGTPANRGRTVGDSSGTAETDIMMASQDIENEVVMESQEGMEVVMESQEGMEQETAGDIVEPQQGMDSETTGETVSRQEEIHQTAGEAATTAAPPVDPGGSHERARPPIPPGPPVRDPGGTHTAGPGLEELLDPDIPVPVRDP